MLSKDCYIQFDSLELDFDDIYLSLGAGYIPDDTMQSMLHSMKTDIAAHCNPQYHYSMLNASQGSKSFIGIENTLLHTGSTITPFLKDASYYILFVATAGHEFERYQQKIKQTGDIVHEFMLDIYGSVIAEAIVKEACKDMEYELNRMGYKVSYPYSPGYCGWPVKEQQTLFSLLPKNPATVCLSDSSLMTPIKSVSGIVAVGKNISKQKYGCEICTKTSCYKNRNK